MREILFRGKRLDNGEWVEGTYLHLNVGKDYICPGAVWIGTLQPCKYDVDPSTVGQYTGLKDMNGKRIFEGDIVQYEERLFYSGNVLVAHPVMFEEGGFCVRYYFLSNWLRNGFGGNIKLEGIEVIGNIHDNPELLDGGAE